MPQSRDHESQIVHLKDTINQLEADRTRLVAAFPLSPSASIVEANSNGSIILSSDMNQRSPGKDILQAAISRSCRYPSVHSHSQLLPSNSWTRISSNDTQATKTLQDADAVIRLHIRLLQKYNAVKDVAHGLMGILADKRGVRVTDVREEFGVRQLE